MQSVIFRRDAAIKPYSRMADARDTVAHRMIPPSVIPFVSPPCVDAAGARHGGDERILGHSPTVIATS